MTQTARRFVVVVNCYQGDAEMESQYVLGIYKTRNAANAAIVADVNETYEELNADARKDVHAFIDASNIVDGRYSLSEAVQYVIFDAPMFTA